MQGGAGEGGGQVTQNNFLVVSAPVMSYFRIVYINGNAYDLCLYLVVLIKRRIAALGTGTLPRTVASSQMERFRP